MFFSYPKSRSVFPSACTLTAAGLGTINNLDETHVHATARADVMRAAVSLTAGTGRNTQRVHHQLLSNAFIFARSKSRNTSSHRHENKFRVFVDDMREEDQSKRQKKGEK